MLRWDPYNYATDPAGTYAAEPEDGTVLAKIQEAQRQADDAAVMAQHALNGVVGLAGVGGAENGRDGSARIVAADHGVSIGAGDANFKGGASRLAS